MLHMQHHKGALCLFFCIKEFAMKVVKAAAVQISPVLYSREATVAKVVQKIHELGQQGVQFATFPETVVPYYPYFAAVQTGIQSFVWKRASEAARPVRDGAVSRDRRNWRGGPEGRHGGVDRSQRA
jgi:Predicted amidohydrolase